MGRRSNSGPTIYLAPLICPPACPEGRLRLSPGVVHSCLAGVRQIEGIGPAYAAKLLAGGAGTLHALRSLTPGRVELLCGKGASSSAFGAGVVTQARALVALAPQLTAEVAPVTSPMQPVPVTLRLLRSGINHPGQASKAARLRNASSWILLVGDHHGRLLLIRSISQATIDDQAETCFQLTVPARVGPLCCHLLHAHAHGLDSNLSVRMPFEERKECANERKESATSSIKGAKACAPAAATTAGIAAPRAPTSASIAHARPATTSANAAASRVATAGARTAASRSTTTSSVVSVTARGPPPVPTRVDLLEASLESSDEDADDRIQKSVAATAASAQQLLHDHARMSLPSHYDGSTMAPDDYELFGEEAPAEPPAADKPVTVQLSTQRPEPDRRLAAAAAPSPALHHTSPNTAKRKARPLPDDYGGDAFWAKVSGTPQSRARGSDAVDRSASTAKSSGASSISTGLCAALSSSVPAGRSNEVGGSTVSMVSGEKSLGYQLADRFQMARAAAAVEHTPTRPAMMRVPVQPLDRGKSRESCCARVGTAAACDLPQRRPSPAHAMAASQCIEQSASAPAMAAVRAFEFQKGRQPEPTIASLRARAPSVRSFMVRGRRESKYALAAMRCHTTLPSRVPCNSSRACVQQMGLDCSSPPQDPGHGGLHQARARTLSQFAPSQLSRSTDTWWSSLPDHDQMATDDGSGQWPRQRAAPVEYRREVLASDGATARRCMGSAAVASCSSSERSALRDVNRRSAGASTLFTRPGSSAAIADAAGTKGGFSLNSHAEDWLRLLDRSSPKEGKNARQADKKGRAPEHATMGPGQATVRTMTNLFSRP